MWSSLRFFFFVGLLLLLLLPLNVRCFVIRTSRGVRSPNVVFLRSRPRPMQLSFFSDAFLRTFRRPIIEKGPLHLPVNNTNISQLGRDLSDSLFKAASPIEERGTQSTVTDDEKLRRLTQPSQSASSDALSSSWMDWVQFGRLTANSEAKREIGMGIKSLTDAPLHSVLNSSTSKVDLQNSDMNNVSSKYFFLLPSAVNSTDFWKRFSLNNDATSKQQSFSDSFSRLIAHVQNEPTFFVPNATVISPQQTYARPSLDVDQFDFEVEVEQDIDSEEESSIQKKSYANEFPPSSWMNWSQFSLAFSRPTAAGSVRDNEDDSQFSLHTLSLAKDTILRGAEVELGLNSGNVSFTLHLLDQMILRNASFAHIVSLDKELLDAFCTYLSRPFDVFNLFRSKPLIQRDDEVQKSILSLLVSLVRSGDDVVRELQRHSRLRGIIEEMTSTFALSPGAKSNNEIETNSRIRDFLRSFNNSDEKVVSPSPSLWPSSPTKPLPPQATPLPSLSVESMSSLLSNALGTFKWRPRSSNQRGLRILSLDGGGTRGVIAITFLKEFFREINRERERLWRQQVRMQNFDYRALQRENEEEMEETLEATHRLEPFHAFDLICGTSTGGILAVLLSAQRATIEQSEKLYDALISKIFASKSGLNFVRKQSFYDVRTFDSLLEELCADELLIDSARHQNTPKCFCVSSKIMLNSAPQLHLWRNYHPPLVEMETASQPSGSCSLPTKVVIRATTAAPTFFPAVRVGSHLYCDGALVANNPTALAVQEAKSLFPGVPIECIVSLGTGYFLDDTQSNREHLSLDALLQQLIAAITDTERVDSMMPFLLPKEKDSYVRLQLRMARDVPIDTKAPAVLIEMKQWAQDAWRAMLDSPNSDKLKRIIRTLAKS